MLNSMNKKVINKIKEVKEQESSNRNLQLLVNCLNECKKKHANYEYVFDSILLAIEKFDSIIDYKLVSNEHYSNHYYNFVNIYDGNTVFYLSLVTDENKKATDIDTLFLIDNNTTVYYGFDQLDKDEPGLCTAKYDYNYFIDVPYGVEYIENVTKSVL